MSSEGKTRLEYLDSLRGLAAAMVMCFHFILVLGSETQNLLTGLANFFLNTLDLGKVGVVIFFVISGFVIPYSIKGQGRSALKNFAISRFFRLYPVYWLSAILGMLIYKSEIGVFLTNLTMLQQFVGVENIIGLYWTLQLELIFYFLISLLLLVGKQNNIKYLFTSAVGFLVLAVPMAYVRSAMHIKLPLAIPLGLSVMFFGSFLRFYILEKNAISKKLSSWYLLIFMILIPVISRLGYNVDFGFSENWLKYVISYFTAIIIFLGFTLPKLHFRFLNYLGLISYSLYLFHPLVISVLGPFWESMEINPLISFFSSALVAILFSHMTYLLVEKPATSLGRKIRKTYAKVRIKS